MKNKKVENIITAILAAAVLITGGMSLYSYLSEQKAKNEYDTIRQEAVVEESRVEDSRRPIRISGDGFIFRRWISAIRWYRARTTIII